MALNLVLGLVVHLLGCLILYLVHRHQVKKGHPPFSKWYVIVPHLITIAGMLVLTAMVTYHLFVIDKVRVISGSLTVFVIFLLSLRGTLRYKRKSSILLTTFLFICFAMTFLFLDRTEMQAFSWQGVALFAIAIVIWTAAAVHTFREPRAAEGAPASAEPVETAEQS